MFQIFVAYEGERKEITDLYWFEENGVHKFGGTGTWGEKYIFELFFNGKLLCEIYPEKG